VDVTCGLPGLDDAGQAAVERDMTTKTALVTGASSGIGEATARKLCELGLIVYAAARPPTASSAGIRPLISARCGSR
jgi:NAD(P)-dependent dehydrogenase (short-subunit alcohol dehydrogenase family)